MADLIDPLEYGQLYSPYSGGGLGSGGDDPYSAMAYAPGAGGDQAPPPPPQPPPAPAQGGGGFSSLFPSWLGGTSDQQPPRSALPQTTGIGGLGSNSLIGLGLGLMAGNRFDPYGRAIAGYQTGARTDLAARQAEEAAQYHQSELGLRKQSLAQQREIAFKPQVHYYEDQQGFQRASVFYPSDPTNFRNVSVETANKLAGQGGVGATIDTSFGTITVPPWARFKDYQKMAEAMDFDVRSGKISADQGRANFAARGMEMAEAALTPPPDSGKPRLDKELADPKFRVLDALPGGILGAVARTKMTPRQREAQDAMNAWITHEMMRRGMQDVSNENRRREIGRVFFPQLGETDDATVNAKATLRQGAREETVAGASPAFRAEYARRQKQAAPPAGGGGGATHMLNGRPIAYDQGRKAWIYTDSGAVAQ